jgi:hypothetical protein
MLKARLATAAALIALAAAAPAHASAAKPEIEVVFALDTTGSMTNLIAGAKKKIWSIASEVLETEEQAEIRFGLIGYRDRGDEYVTRIYDLTDDINGIYGHLLEFEADGGGDRPESVNQALNEAVTQMSWSSGENTLRLVFLVGDSPPNEYQDDVDYDRTAELARQRDIILNTVLAGGASDTRAIWKAIAQLGDGTFMEIPQDGGMQVVETPYDQRIDDLQKKINDTVIPYGDFEKQAYLAEQRDEAAAAAPSVKSDMAAVRMKAGKLNRVLTGGNDLVEDYEDGKIDIDAIDADELPEGYSDDTRGALREAVETNVAARAALNAEMADLVEQRDAYIAAELERMAAEEGEDAFDLEVAKTVRAQAAEKGIDYKD